jgi:hypothetical protein
MPALCFQGSRKRSILISMQHALAEINSAFDAHCRSWRPSSALQSSRTFSARHSYLQTCPIFVLPFAPLTWERRTRLQYPPSCNFVCGRCSRRFISASLTMMVASPRYGTELTDAVAQHSHPLMRYLCHPFCQDLILVICYGSLTIDPLFSSKNLFAYSLESRPRPIVSATVAYFPVGTPEPQFISTESILPTNRKRLLSILAGSICTVCDPKLCT